MRYSKHEIKNFNKATLKNIIHKDTDFDGDISSMDRATLISVLADWSMLDYDSPKYVEPTAINTDENGIFAVKDAGTVADLFESVEEEIAEENTEVVLQETAKEDWETTCHITGEQITLRAYPYTDGQLTVHISKKAHQDIHWARNKRIAGKDSELKPKHIKLLDQLCVTLVYTGKSIKL